MTTATQQTTERALDPEILDALVGQAVGDFGSVLNAALVVVGDRLGLYRTVSGRGGSDQTTDELIAPFASSARFYYYTMNPYGNPRDSAVTTPPGNLNNLRGFRIFLPAESSDTMPTRNTPQSATVSTAVFFKNTRFP